MVNSCCKGATITNTCLCGTCASCGPVTCNPNCESIYNRQFNATISINSAWNIPQCGTSAIVYSVDTRRLVVGSMLWHPTHGYFEVTDIYSSTNRIGIRNICVGDGISAAGTLIPACTEFILAGTPFAPSDLFGVFLTSNFVAPAISDCIAINITSTDGLVVGMYIRIGTYLYRVSTISSSTGITICNDGGGFPGGTIVTAQDSAGRYIYSISVENSAIGGFLTKFLSQDTSIAENAVGYSDNVTVVGNPITLAAVGQVPYLYYGSIIGTAYGRVTNGETHVFGAILDVTGGTLSQFPQRIDTFSQFIGVDINYHAQSLRQPFSVIAYPGIPITFTPSFEISVVSSSDPAIVALEILTLNMVLRVNYLGVPL